MELILKHLRLSDSDSSGFMLSGCLSACPSISDYFLRLLIDCLVQTSTLLQIQSNPSNIQR